MTDTAQLPKPEPVIRALPRGAAVIYRDYGAHDRSSTARRLLSICRSRGVLFLVGANESLALTIGADGVHRPGHAPWPKGSDSLILTASAHTGQDLEEAAAHGAQVALLSPVYRTDSHPGAPPLGSERFKALAAAAPLPVMALGGVDETNAAPLVGHNVCGLAAISAFVRGA